MSSEAKLDIGRRLSAEVLQPMKQSFVGKDEIIDLLGVSLVGASQPFEGRTVSRGGLLIKLVLRGRRLRDRLNCAHI